MFRRILATAAGLVVPITTVLGMTMMMTPVAQADVCAGGYIQGPFGGGAGGQICGGLGYDNGWNNGYGGGGYGYDNGWNNGGWDQGWNNGGCGGGCGGGPVQDLVFIQGPPGLPPMQVPRYQGAWIWNWDPLVNNWRLDPPCGMC